MLRVVRQWIIDTLGFSKSEANGTLILIILILLTAISPKIYLHNTFSTENGFTAENENLEVWARELEMSLVKKEEQKQLSIVEEERTLKSYHFNPNTATMDQFLELGFSEKTSHILMNFREKGGTFHIKSDLLKIYGISEKRVLALWNYIELPTDYPEKAKPKPDTSPGYAEVHNEEVPLQISINAANKEEFQKIHGIGSRLSDRILRFRNALGGFHSLNQLDEIYGLDPEVAQSLKEASVLSGEIKKLNINTDSANSLYCHPYIDYKIAYSIVNYRAQHGDYDSVSQIKRIKIVSDSLYQKIYPYLSLNQ